MQRRMGNKLARLESFGILVEIVNGFGVRSRSISVVLRKIYASTSGKAT
jgi:hypothetical protein